MRGTASFAVESAAPRQSKMRAPPIEHENPRQSSMQFRTNEKRGTASSGTAFHRMSA